MTKLVPLARRCVLSSATVKRQTGVVSGDLGGRILGTGNKAPRGVIYCFQRQDRDLSDLCRRYTRLSFQQQSACVYASPPVQGMHAASGLAAAVSSYQLPVARTQAKRERKPNEILTRI